MTYQRVVVTKFGGPEVLKLVQEDMLPEPEPGEVRLKVQAAGVAFTDVMIRKGKYPEAKDKPPFTLGYDLVGQVDALGPGANRFRLGQRVADLTVIGAQSEYVCLAEDRLTPVPDDLDAAEAVSLILPYVTAYQMLHRMAGIKQGQRIVMHGAGGAVGTAMLQLGSLLDLEMYATASEAKHELVSSLGATPIDYRRGDWSDRLLQLAKGGVDAVFDPIGGHNFKQSFKTLRSQGTLVAFGFYNAVMGKGGNIPRDFLRLKLWNLLPNSRAAVFYSIAALRKQQPQWFSEDLTRLFDLLSRRRIKPILSQRLPLSEVSGAHERLEKAAVQGKIVFDLGGAEL